MFFPKSKKGFTLIELLVVIAIVGILAGIVLVSLSGARASARDARRQSNINSIKTAMELYYNDNNAYYSNTAMPTTQLPSLNPVPFDPTNSGNYIYKWVDNSANAQSYCAYALLEKAPTGVLNHYFVTDPKGPRQFDSSTAPAALPCN